ncbi:MAG: hypothetical protein GY835_12495 [bacterium]|nr:hypothetical protein [bacterium]
MGNKKHDNEPHATPTKPVFERIFWPMIALVLPIIITTISAHTYNVKSERDSRLRLYSELISQRENSESKMRIDMLNTLMGNFFKSKADQSTDSTMSIDYTLKTIDEDILQLELITYNFHESLQLSPLFHSVNRKLIGLKSRKDSEDRLDEITAMNKRLLNLARKVISKQVETLQGHGDVQKYKLSISDYRTGRWKRDIRESFENLIDNTNASIDRTKISRGLAQHVWNDELEQVVRDEIGEERNIVLLQRDLVDSALSIVETLSVVDSTWNVLWDTVGTADGGVDSVIGILKSNMGQIDPTAQLVEGPYLIDDLITLYSTSGDSVHCMRGALEIMDLKEDEHEIRIRLEIVQCMHGVRDAVQCDGGKGQAKCWDHTGCEALTMEIEGDGFHVGVFDFPLIDNTRLNNDLRFSVFIKQWSDSIDGQDAEIELGFALFPGYVASLREKSYFKDIMERLNTD